MTPALDAAYRLEHGRDCGLARDSKGDVTKHAISAAKARMDIIQCLLDRREFEADRITDNIIHITLMSDSSPTTGEEIQGQVVDYVRRRGGHRRTTLPGVSISYSHCNAVNKTVGLLWAIWLVAGPSLVSMQYFVSKVFCITTDNGVEMGILETPDILTAFVAWVSGTDLLSCGAFVRDNRRLFYNALRISGWGHLMGNLLKTIFNRFHRWPTYLEKIRLMIWFFRNTTYRKHIQLCLKGTNVDASAMDHFSADIAKWRFQTLFVTFGALLQVRRIAQHHLARIWFQNVQDAVKVEAAITHCHDQQLWSFIATSFTEVIEPTEWMRRWGMICNCSEHNRQRREDGVKHIHCELNSRRLPQVPERVTRELNEIKTRASSMTEAKAEGDVEIANFVKNMLLMKATELRQRTKYLNIVPWSFCRANTAEGAKACIMQVEKFTMDKHDPVTVAIMAKYGQDVKRVAEGGDVSQELAALVEALCYALLDESAGEGVHRADTLEKQRAPASTTQHIKQAARERDVICRTNEFLDKHGHQGRQVVRFEWKHWKRLLTMAAKKKRWLGVKWKTRAVTERIYREDAFAQQDWTAIAQTRSSVGRPTHVNLSAQESVQNEYLANLLERNRFYSVDVPNPAFDESGQPEPDRTTYFHVEDKVFGSSRPHLMPTVESSMDAVVKEPLAVCVQIHERSEHPEAMADAHTHIFPAEDSEWVVPTSIAPFDLLHTQLFDWKYKASPVIPGCTQVSDPVRAKPRIELMDPKCPAQLVYDALMDRGWKPVAALCDHQDHAVSTFDGRLAIRMRSYYQALLQIRTVMPLTSHLPSQEPVHYYNLLLKGTRVEPGETAQHYLLLWNGLKKRKGQPPDVVPLCDRRPPPLSNEDTVILAAPARHERASGSGGVGPKRPRVTAGVPPAVPVVDPTPPVVVEPTPSRPSPPPLSSPPVPVIDDPVVEDVVALGPEGDGSDGDVPAAGSSRDAFQPALMGAEVVYQQYHDRKKGTSYWNWILKCPRHANCYKKRLVTKQSTKRHGDVEALAYVHAWIPKEPASEDMNHANRTANPSDADVDAVVAAHRAELQVIVGRHMA